MSVAVAINKTKLISVAVFIDAVAGNFGCARINLAITVITIHRIDRFSVNCITGSIKCYNRCSNVVAISIHVGINKTHCGIDAVAVLIDSVTGNFGCTRIDGWIDRLTINSVQRSVIVRVRVVRIGFARVNHAIEIYIFLVIVQTIGIGISAARIGSGGRVRIACPASGSSGI
ncbi:hypothetical protein DSECCO2_551360 [anaerobic digester metagenome]